MERLPGAATHIRHHHRVPPTADRFLGTLHPPQPSAAAASLELTEEDIFSTPMECLPLSSTRPIPNPNPEPAHNKTLNHYGILAALNSYSSRSRSRSGSSTRPVFNHKASPPPPTSGIMIPKPPTTSQGGKDMDRARLVAHSAPINIPVRSARHLEDDVSDGEEELSGLTLPPHELVESRYSPMLACSVMEGAGRTLKGRDLRQVRNAIWRKTGFID